MQPQRHFGHHAQRSFSAHKQPRQIVARARFARPRPSVNHAPIRQHHRQPQHIFAHRPIAHRRGPRGPRRRHPANRRVRARIDKKCQSRIFKRLDQRQPANPRLHRRVQVLHAHPQHAIHLPHVDADAALERMHMPLQRSPRAKRHDRQPVPRAHLHNPAHLFRALRKTNQVRQRRRMRALAVAVMLPRHHCRRHPLAQQRAQLPQRRVNDSSVLDSSVHGPLRRRKNLPKRQNTRRMG